MAKRAKSELDTRQLVFDEPELLLHPATMPSRRKRTTISSHMERLLDTAVDIRQNRDAVERAFMARQLVQCTLPHSDPGNLPVWRRVNGHLTLKIIPDVDKANNALYPFGSIPRLLLFWLVTEAKQKKSRRIELGKSLADFMRGIGLNPRTGGGKRGDAKRLQEQMKRLINARISFESETEAHGRYLHMDVSSSAELWWDNTRTLQSNLWDSWIELGEKFYEAITTSAVPVDLRALRALKRSPLALDLYAWFTYTAYIAGETRKDRVVPWEGLHGQMGGEYSNIKNFRPKVVAAIAKIRTVYPELKVEVTAKGLTVMPSRPAIASKKH